MASKLRPRPGLLASELGGFVERATTADSPVNLPYEDCLACKSLERGTKQKRDAESAVDEVQPLLLMGPFSDLAQCLT